MPADTFELDSDGRAALTRLAREDGGRVLAVLARRFGDVDLADDAVQDALVEATRAWPEQGVPANPPAWLLTVARRKAIDRLRRSASARRRTLAAAPELLAEPDPIDDRKHLVSDDPDDMTIDDDHLRLMLLCCHPALDSEAQVALTLRLVGGLTTQEIAAAFLVPEATLAQRIVRAKRKIRDAAIPLSIPAHFDDRIDTVLAVLYLVFNEGYLSRSGSVTEAIVRVDLVDEAVRLTEVLATLLPDNAEVLGLLALQRFHRARNATRTDVDGDLVLLEHQDRTRWNIADVEAANTSLHTAMQRMRPGPYQLQAVIAAHHANARTAADTDWPAIAHAYRQLSEMTRSPVVGVNHAVAVAMADGPPAGLALLEAVEGVSTYHLYHAARAELLWDTGLHAQAIDAFALARSLTANPAEQRHLDRRRRACESQSSQ